jgi:hypothetical protein
MLVCPTFALAEERWNAKIREFCEREWSDEPVIQRRCVSEQVGIAFSFAHTYDGQV